MKRCIGFTGLLKRCKRTQETFFCHDHSRQPIKWIFILIFSIGTGILSYVQYFDNNIGNRVDYTAPPDFKINEVGVLVTNFYSAHNAIDRNGIDIAYSINNTLLAVVDNEGLSVNSLPLILNKNNLVTSHAVARAVGIKFKASFVVWGAITESGILPRITIIDQELLKDYKGKTILSDKLTHSKIPNNIKMEPLSDHFLYLSYIMESLALKKKIRLKNHGWFLFSKENHDIQLKRRELLNNSIKISKTIRISPHYSYYYLSDTYLSQNDEKVELLNKAINLSPDFSEAYHSKSVVCTLRYVTKSLSGLLNPHKDSKLFSGNIDECIELTRQAINIEGDNNEYFTWLIQQYSLKKDTEAFGLLLELKKQIGVTKKYLSTARTVFFNLGEHTLSNMYVFYKREMESKKGKEISYDDDGDHLSEDYIRKSYAANAKCFNISINVMLALKRENGAWKYSSVSMPFKSNSDKDNYAKLNEAIKCYDDMNSTYGDSLIALLSQARLKLVLGNMPSVKILLKKARKKIDLMELFLIQSMDYSKPHKESIDQYKIMLYGIESLSLIREGINDNEKMNSYKNKAAEIGRKKPLCGYSEISPDLIAIFELSRIQLKNE